MIGMVVMLVGMLLVVLLMLTGVRHAGAVRILQRLECGILIGVRDVAVAVESGQCLHRLGARVALRA